MNNTIIVINERPIVFALMNMSNLRAVTEEAVSAGFESAASEELFSLGGDRRTHPPLT